MSRFRRLLFGLFLGVLFASQPRLPVQAAIPETGPFDPGELSFSVDIGSLNIPFRVFTVFVLPGEALDLTPSVRLRLDASAGQTHRTEKGWRWIAPNEFGLQQLSLRHGEETMTLNVFVMRPAAEVVDGSLGDYRIGEYSKTPFRGLAVYQRPRGLVEVTPDLAGVPVSPHFTLGQFLCKQESGWPKYLVLRPELLIKLERLLAEVNAAGIQTNGFEIMSGYRTPWYNRLIGNRTSSSRHLYGGAVDLFIDNAPRDGLMDDLNGDGLVSRDDADYLYDLVDRLSQSVSWKTTLGGLAAYKATSAHGPFVHVDARGYRARWGQ